ncbi:MAG: hypothetical protein J5490_01130 [Bacteroidales bacterium]|nr:hypothetical protein [Bacteroidales bacterium]
MKKFYLLLAALILLPALCSAQAKIYTKKVKLSDFPTKTTKIVLSGSDMLDGPLKEEIARRWRISPYEFCTLEEYDNLKKDDSYYFLRMVDVSGVSAFALSKEGLEVINLPYCTSGNPSGREMLYMPAFIDIMQAYVMDSINSDMTGYLGLKNYSKNLYKSANKKIYISKGDLAAPIDSKWAAKGIRIMDEDDVDDVFLEEDDDCVVSYSVAPAPGTKKGKCCVFLLNAATHELYFYASHKVSSGKKSGFTSADMSIISALKKK